jgi:hypothetical protein
LYDGKSYIFTDYDWNYDHMDIIFDYVNRYFKIVEPISSIPYNIKEIKINIYYSDVIQPMHLILTTNNSPKLSFINSCFKLLLEKDLNLYFRDDNHLKLSISSLHKKIENPTLYATECVNEIYRIKDSILSNEILAFMSDDDNLSDTD